MFLNKLNAQFLDEYASEGLAMSVTLFSECIFSYEAISTFRNTTDLLTDPLNVRL